MGCKGSYTVVVEVGLLHVSIIVEILHAESLGILRILLVKLGCYDALPTPSDKRSVIIICTGQVTSGVPVSSSVSALLPPDEAGNADQGHHHDRNDSTGNRSRIGAAVVVFL